MPIIDIKKNSSSVGELVWIPANTPLMFYLPKEEYEFAWRATEKKEPTYGLIVSEKNDIYRVIVGKEEFYVQKRAVYGVEDDYKP
jgi:hypothetical protein